MLNAISEQEIQQQGLAVIEKAIQSGVVHIMKNNKPRYVVLTEEFYQHLSKKKTAPYNPVLAMMLSKPCTGTRSKADIDKQINDIRESWGE